VRDMLTPNVDSSSRGDPHEPGELRGGGGVLQEGPGGQA